MLIISFSVNFAGIIAGFIVLRIKIKHEMKSLVFENLKEKDFEIVKISKNEIAAKKGTFRFNNSHEFFFKGKLYDFSHYKVVRDEVWFYAINDTKEESLIDNFSSLLNDKLSDRTASAKNAFNILLQTLTADFIFHKFEKFGFFLESFNTIPQYSISYTGIVQDIFSPPPNLSSNFLMQD